MCWISVETQLPANGEEVDLFTVEGKRLAQFTCVNNAALITVFFTRPGFPRAVPLREVTHFRYPPSPPTGRA
jgi:hypothetical protein